MQICLDELPVTLYHWCDILAIFSLILNVTHSDNYVQFARLETTVHYRKAATAKFLVTLGHRVATVLRFFSDQWVLNY